SRNPASRRCHLEVGRPVWPWQWPRASRKLSQGAGTRIGAAASTMNAGETLIMQRSCISVPKRAPWIGLGVVLAATAAFELNAQRAPNPHPPWTQVHPTPIADPKLAPIPPPPLPTPADKLPLDKLKVKAGFKIEVFAAGVANARTLRLGDKGTVFVSS